MAMVYSNYKGCFHFALDSSTSTEWCQIKVGTPETKQPTRY